MAGGSADGDAHGAREAAHAVTPPAWRRIIGAAALLAALANLLFGLVARRDPWSAADFVQVLAWSGEWLRGLNPYAPPYSLADYPPNALVALAPLAALPVPAAMAAWTLLHAALTVVIAVMASRLAPLGRGAPLFAALVAALPPFRIVLQFSAVSFAAALLGVLIADRRPVLAGLAIGMSLIKPHIGGPMLLWAAASRRWKTCTAALAVPAALFAVYLLRSPRSPLAVIGEWVQAVARTQNRGDLPPGETSLQPLVDAMSAPPLAIQFAILTALAAGLALIWIRRGPDFDLRFAAAACLLSLLAFRHLSYNLLLAIPALAFAASRAGRAARALAVSAFAALIASPPSLWRHVVEPRGIDTALDPLAAHAYRIVLAGLFLFVVFAAPPAGRPAPGARDTI